MSNKSKKLAIKREVLRLEELKKDKDYEDPDKQKDLQNRIDELLKMKILNF